MKKKKTNLKWCLLATFMFALAPTVSNAMHIMEGFLPVKWAVIWYVLFIPFFVVGLKNITKVVQEHPKKKLLLALCGAFVFVLSALKIPSVTGSCSHPTGVGLAAILFGNNSIIIPSFIISSWWNNNFRCKCLFNGYIWTNYIIFNLEIMQG